MTAASGLSSSGNPYFFLKIATYCILFSYVRDESFNPEKLICKEKQNLPIYKNLAFY
jgi:hypothetical protein